MKDGPKTTKQSMDDVMQNHITESEAEGKQKQIRNLLEASKLIHSTLDMEKVLKHISSSVRKLIGFDNLAIFLISDDRTHLYRAYASGGTRGKKKVILDYGEGIVGLCVKNREIFTGSALTDERLKKMLGLAHNFKSHIIFPLVTEDECIGALCLSKHAENAYTRHDIDVLNLVNDVISTAIKNAAQYNQVKRFNQELEKEISNTSTRTDILLEAKKALQSETGWEEGIRTIVQTMLDLGFERCGISLVNLLRKTLDLHCGMGAELPPEGTSVPLSDSDYFGVKCVLEKRTIHVRTYNSAEGKQITSESESFVWVPIIFQNEVLAALAADNIESRKAITEEDVKDLEILAGLCAAFIDRTRVLIEPVPEKTLKTGFKNWLDPLEGYIIVERKSVKSFEVFCDLVTHGVPGFVISRDHPDKIRRKYKLVRTPIMWLSRSRIENSIPPSDLPKMNHIIRNFTEKSEETVILLDGLEYLITQIGFDVVVKYLQELKDLVVLNNSRLIIPLHRDMLSDREYSVLEKEFTILKSERDILDFDTSSVHNIESKSSLH